MKRRTISPKENYLRAMTRSARPEWLSISPDGCAGVMPSIVGERPIYGTARGKDWFGCEWIWDEESFGFAPDLHQPYLLQDIRDWREVVQFPDLDSYDWEAIAARDLANIDRDEFAILFVGESGPFERSHHLMGLENAMIAMMEEPDEYKALVNAITDFKVDWFNHVLPYYKPDIVNQMDDLGTASGPIVSLELYRELLLPCHRRISECIRSHGALHLHHSCGKMDVFIPDLLDAGATIFNCLQRVNDRKAVAERYSDRASFEIVFDTVSNPMYTEEDIVREVHETIDIFAPVGNISVFPFMSNANTKDRLDFAIEEARRYGEKVW